MCQLLWPEPRCSQPSEWVHHVVSPELRRTTALQTIRSVCIGETVRKMTALGAKLPLRRLVAAATHYCRPVGRQRQPRVKPLPLWEGWGRVFSKKITLPKFFHPPPSRAPYPHLVPSSATPRGVAARWGRRWGKGDDVNLFLRGFEKRRPPNTGDLGVKASPRVASRKGRYSKARFRGGLPAGSTCGDERQVRGTNRRMRGAMSVILN